MRPFRYLLRVRYAECDAQKVVYNPRYGDYVDLASTEFLRAVWGKLVFPGGGLDFKVVRQVIDWQSPAVFDDILEIAVSPGRLGTSSFVLTMELRVLGAERTVATSETTYVLVHEVEQTKRTVPDDMRRRFEAGAPGVVVDHAGAGHAAHATAP